VTLDELRAEEAALERLDRANDNEDLKAVMGLKAGRRLLWRLLEREAGVLRSSYALEPLAMAFSEGQRSLGLALMADVQAQAPEDYLLMLAEEHEARRLRAQHLEALRKKVAAVTD